MPKQTFFNLEKDKQEKIFNVAITEFSRVPFHEASIANVIKNANISRGSFYQYFENKFDLFMYVLNKIRKATMSMTEKLMEGEKNDIFVISEKMFIYQLELVDNPIYHNFFKNMFLNLNYELEKNLYDFKTENEEMNQLFANKFDTSDFKNKDIEYILKIKEIVMLVIKKCMVMKFIQEKSNNDVLQIYKDYIDIIKEGVVNKC